jgi:hypothetical protein
VVLLVLLHANSLAVAFDPALTLGAVPGGRVALAFISPEAGGGVPGGRALAGFAFAKPFLPLIDVK